MNAPLKFAAFEGKARVSMSVLVWLAIPLVALVIGIVWAYFLSRPARPAAMEESMESFTRFRRALAEHPKPGAKRRPRRSVAMATVIVTAKPAAKPTEPEHSAARSN
jgi:hypothetical protein